ncbi:MAG: hypothetical protein ACK2T0_03265 [Anaerolineales bacterium]
MGWTWIDTLAITYVRQRIGGSAAARPRAGGDQAPNSTVLFFY